MKVKELIENLQKADPEADVYINCPNDDANWQAHLWIDDGKKEEIEL